MRPTRILETALYGQDLDAMRAFYEGVLGLEVYRAVPEKFVFFRMAEQMLLVFNPVPSAAQDIKDGPPPHGAAGAGHVCFRAPDGGLAKWQAHLEARGVVIEKVLDWPEGGRSVYFRDPAGNSLEFAEGSLWEFPPMRSLCDQKIVIATHNKGKLEEFAALLKPYGVEAVSAGSLGLPEPAETETTFAGNARIKALSAMKASGLIAVSDDSGLCVAALGGEPGVYTADWAGADRDWTRAMRLVEEKLQAKGATTPEKRRAYFACTLCVVWPNGEERIYEGRAPGTLAWPPRGALGHGYDPMFVPDGETRTFAELAPEEKNRISHRAKALEQLVRDLF
ncbi:RdgB/HAM1 family non-canonical purine NTP pyrophosphatase [Aestuariivirga sp.]|uniref:RdgB/HAM1 family non-canonical purine NTP pyrophosphatase n=1 Tax=Aestuariivirga sp. TaxID=2650926 RepID=UPI0035B09868